MDYKKDTMQDTRMTKLHFFTPFGTTYTFKDVAVFRENESVITFSFISAKDGTEKHGVVFVKNIMGYSYEGNR